MDLLAISRTIWRLKLATLPVLALTLFGVFCVVAVKEPVYEASSSFILINPPAAPTAEAIQQDPELGKISPDNPYTRSGDLSVVVDVLSRNVGNDRSRRVLVAAGADRRYQVMPSLQFGFSSPIVQITGVGASAEGAIRTARLVGKAVTQQLDGMQRAQGVNARYRITPLQVDIPAQAQLRVSGQLRMLVGIVALGVILLFVIVSVGDAVTSRRAERAAPDERPSRAPEPRAPEPYVPAHRSARPEPEPAGVPEARVMRINGRPTGRLRQGHGPVR